MTFKPLKPYQPWYDDERDYNTNAPSYFDYLSNHNQIIKVLTDVTNKNSNDIVSLQHYDEVLKGEIDNEVERAKASETTISESVSDLDKSTKSLVTSLRNENDILQKNVNSIFNTYDSRLHAIEKEVDNITRLPASGENPQSLESLKTAWNSHTYTSPKSAIDSQFGLLAESFNRTNNLFNKTLTTDGYYKNYNTGNINPNEKYFFSDEFYVVPGNHYYVFNKNDNLGFKLHVAFFNSEHTYVSGTQYGSFDIPETATYMVFSAPISEKDNIMVTKGSFSKTDYEPYYSTLKKPDNENNFTVFKDKQINQKYNTLDITSNNCSISFIGILNSQIYQPKTTLFKKGDFFIGCFNLKTDKDLNSFNLQFATPDGQFHNNIYYNLESGKEYTLYFNTSKMGDITSQDFYIIFKSKNNLVDVTNIKISNFKFYINKYNVNNFNFNTDFNVSSDNTTPFYDIQNCIEFVKKLFDVSSHPVTIHLSNETFTVKMSDKLPYSIDKGANKISIVGEGSNLTKIIKYCTSTNQGKIIDAGGDCVLKGFTIEYKKDSSYNSENDYGSNPYCIHLDKSPKDESKPYATKIEDVVAINEVNAPIGAGLRHNQKLIYKDVTLINRTSNGKNGALYVHGPNVSTAKNCSFEAYNVYAIAENDGYAVNMGNVNGSLPYTEIDCTFNNLGVIEDTPKDYQNFKKTHKISKKSFNNNNNNFNY